MFAKSEEEWLLFLKNKKLIEEDQLLRYLASKFKVDKKIMCYDHWNDDNSNANKIYLWIRKDAVDEVKNVLGLDLIMLKDNNA